MEELIFENVMEYLLANDEMYYPIIKCEQKTDFLIGKYGIIVADYIMDNDKKKYYQLIRQGAWNSYLHEMDVTIIREQVEMEVERIKGKEKITEDIKVQNPVEWISRLNIIKELVEEDIIKNACIYS